MVDRLRVEAVVAAKDEASATVGRVRSSFASLGSFLASRFVITLGDVQRIARAVTSALAGFVQAANQQEDAVRKLDQALKGLAGGSQAVSRSLQEQASALQAQTKFGDEAIIAAQALIASFVKEESAIKAATAATLDFAAGTGTELNSAAALIAKTLGSSTNALARYGISVEGAANSTERVTSLTKNLAEVFGGQAQAQAETFSGRIQQLENALGDLGEQIGFAITKNESLNNALDTMIRAVSDPKLIPGFKNLADTVKVLTFTIGELASAIVAKLEGPLGGLVFLLDRASEAYFAGINTIADYIRALEEQEAAERAAAEATEALRAAQEDRARVLGLIADAIDGVVGPTRALNEEEAKLATNAATVAQGLDKTGTAADRASRAFEVLGKAQERVNRIQKEIADATKGLEDRFKSLGIVTEEEANKQLGLLATELRNLEDLWARQGISVRGYEATLRDITFEQEAYRAVLDGTATSVEDYRRQVDAASGAQETLNERTREARVGAEEYQRTLGRLNQALDQSRIRAGLLSSQLIALSVQVAQQGGGGPGTDFTFGGTPVGGSRGTLNRPRNFPLFPGLTGATGTFTIRG